MDPDTRFFIQSELLQMQQQLQNELSKVQRELTSAVGSVTGTQPIDQNIIGSMGNVRPSGTPSGASQGTEAESITVVKELINPMNRLETTIRESAQKTTSSFGQIAASLIGAMSVNQYIMTRFVSQPYQYITQPALSTVGTTGMMGGALSSAYGAQESVLQEYRGMGVRGLGAIGGALGFSFGGVAGGLAGGILGTVAGSVFQDPIANMLSAGMQEDAFETALGREMLDPQKYVENFFRPTLQARMGLGLGGGPIVEDLAAFTNEGSRSLGYDATVVGQMMGNYLSILSPNLSNTLEDTKEETGQNIIDVTAGLEGFGMSRDMIFSVMSDISRAGSQDYQQSLGSLLLATADDGEITNYTANVLVPALSKVVESRAIQNIAKSSEEVTRETAGLFSFFKNSDTNLGKMLSANPEMMDKIFGMLNQVGEQAIQDPALMLYLNRMGLSFSDVVTGDPRAMMMPLQSFANMAEYNADGGINLDSASSISSILGFLTATGIGVNTGTFNIAAEMMSTLNQGGTVSMSDLEEKLRAESPEGQIVDILDQLRQRLDTIAGTEGAQVARDRAEQANTFYNLMEQNLNEIRAIQEVIKTAFSDTEKINDALTLAGAAIIRKFGEIAGFSEAELSSLSEGAAGLFDAESAINIKRSAGVSGEGTTEAIGQGEVFGNALDILDDLRYSLDQGKINELYALVQNNPILRNQEAIAPLVERGLILDAEGIANIQSRENLIDYLQDIYPDINNLQDMVPVGFSTGGYTGVGTRLDPVGVVHGGEYVISDNNVSGNMNTLNRIQSGESLDEYSPEFSSSGDMIRVMLEFSNTNPQAIINAAKASARQLLIDERIL